MEEPDHHRRYREAWTEYRTNFDEQRKVELENEMDSAQNLFGWDEFQAFKVTLPGYVEYWKFLTGDGMLRMSDMPWKKRQKSE